MVEIKKSLKILGIKSLNNGSSTGAMFFGNGSDLDLSYDIPEDMWSKIKFSGINLGYWVPQYHQIQPMCKDKIIDLCAIFQAKHNYSEDHNVRNDTFYTNHRKGLWDKLEPLKFKYNMITERMHR